MNRRLAHDQGRGTRTGARVRVVATRRYAVPLREGYDYITDPRRWPEYWPRLMSIAPESRWSQPGDTASLTLKLLGRPTELRMTLWRIVPYRLIAYTSVQRGLPAANHERHFIEDPRGFGYRIVVDFEPRTGLRGRFDRLVVSRAVARAARQTLDSLERRLAELAPSPESRPIS